jgi:hypothetical protein
MLKTSALLALLGAASPAAAGELDLNFGLQATHTAWSDDTGGGPTLQVGWWFADWIGASFVGKEHYATIDDRYMSYYSLNVALRHAAGPLWIGGSLGFVHQHEQTMSSIEEQPLASAFGVADGMRHRMAARTGFQLALPISKLHRGDMYLALDIDGTYFGDEDRGPRWMQSIGISLGVTRDFTSLKKGK